MNPFLRTHELKMLTAQVQKLHADNVDITRNHVFALRVIEEMGTTMQSRRHRLATWLGRRLGAPEMKPGALDAMLIGIRGVLASMPAPGMIESPDPGPSGVPDEAS